MTFASLRHAFICFSGILCLVPDNVAANQVDAIFNAAEDIPVIADGYQAGGNTVNLILNHEPAVGESLTVVENTGPAWIDGAFDNLAQGQEVVFHYAGKTFHYIANYYAGSGNDLVLQWKNTRLLSWGSGTIPAPVDTSGALAGKSVTFAGIGGCTALGCSDGSVITSGNESYIGRAPSLFQDTPELLDTSGILAGKRLIAISGGYTDTTALASDGTVVWWGHSMGGNETQQTLPAQVVLGGPIAGKHVVGLSGGLSGAGLCSDGTVVWLAPGQQVIDTTGVLAGRKVVALASGNSYSIALCQDGKLVSWGENDSGQLGAGITDFMAANPVAVVQSGVLAGKTVVAIAAGSRQSAALCSDGTLAAWGANESGELGNGNTTSSSVPVLVDRTGALAGKTVVGISADTHTFYACCSDGTLVMWGYRKNSNNLPVIQNIGALKPGEKVIRTFQMWANDSVYALVASAEQPIVTPQAAQPGDDRVTLNALVNANGTDTRLSVEYGLTAQYGSVQIAATPAVVSGIEDTPVQLSLDGLFPATTYHYRLVTTGFAGVWKSDDLTFTTTSHSALSSLTLSEGSLVPAFSPAIANYAETVDYSISHVTVSVTAASPDTIVVISGRQVGPGSLSEEIDLSVGLNAIPVSIEANDGSAATRYTVNVTRLPETFFFGSDSDIGVPGGLQVATGAAPPVQLGFAPRPGTVLTVARNSGLPRVTGSFTNLQHGQVIELPFGHSIYRFLVNYYGGRDGADLVLQWANTRTICWGSNFSTQLGIPYDTFDSNLSNRTPVAADPNGILAGKIVLGGATGSEETLAVTADGLLCGWGEGYPGIPYDGTTGHALNLDPAGTLAGKKIVGIFGGKDVVHVLCSDSTVYSLGNNDKGQYGDGTSRTALIFQPVDQSGVLAGKTISRMVAGDTHVLALCSDNTLVAWGDNSSGQLGISSTSAQAFPVAVDQTGVLAGKTIAAIAAGHGHNLILCTDGTLVGWGENTLGQIGNGGITNLTSPTLVPHFGALAGKTIISVEAGGYNSFAICQDGSIAAWGDNSAGQLGNGTFTASQTPVVVNQTGILAGKKVVRLEPGSAYSLALCSDGTVAAWGSNHYAVLGTGVTMSRSAVPVAVSLAPFGAQERFTDLFRNGYSQHSGGILGIAMPEAATLAAEVTAPNVTLHGSATANNSATTVSFEYGPTSSYGTTIAADQASLNDSTATPVSATLTGLIPGNVYHFRTRSESASGVVVGEDATFGLPAVPVPISTWRQLHFGHSDNAGDAADDADPDCDGIPNALEYAFALDPNQPSSGLLPVWHRDGYEIVLSFTDAGQGVGVTYSASFSSDLSPGSWIAIADTGVGTQHTFRIPITKTRLFFRLEVTTP